MNIVDIIILLLVLATILRGIEVGFVRQAGTLVGMVAGVFMGIWLSSVTNATGFTSLLMIILSAIGGIGAGEYVTIKLKRFLHENVVNHFDKALGGALGVVICLALVWFGSTLVSAIPAQDVQRSVRDSRIIAWLDAELPPASALMDSLEQSLASTGLPDLLREGEPNLDTTDTRLPSLDGFAAVIEQSRSSVVELEGRSCQGIGIGSGFVVADNMVVTNAHVVAGMRNPYVRDQNGRHDADVIAFDSQLDVAVLRVNNLAGQPLNFNNETVAVGTAGVVLGYPGGDPFTARPARVADIFRAIGRDIYEERPTQRPVLALRAEIDPGNSGGPLLDQNGDVIGVIFARSTTYQGVGYALTAPDVQEVVEQAQAAPSRGTSLRCL